MPPRVVKDLGPNPGATGSHTMVCDDCSTYIVKFAGRTKAVVNEFVGQALAKAIALPVPNARLVTVDAEIISQSTDLTYRSIKPGLHQGSEKVFGSLNLNAWRGHLPSELSNADKLPGVISHDNWVLTMDRDRPDNNLIALQEGAQRYVLFDFTHAFTGPEWTADSLEQASYTRVLAPLNPFLAESVTSSKSFEPALAAIEGMEDTSVEEIVAGIPEEWGLTEEESSAMVDFIEVRRGLVRGILVSSRKRFPRMTD